MIRTLPVRFIRHSVVPSGYRGSLCISDSNRLEAAVPYWRLNQIPQISNRAGVRLLQSWPLNGVHLSEQFPRPPGTAPILRLKSIHPLSEQPLPSGKLSVPIGGYVPEESRVGLWRSENLLDARPKVFTKVNTLSTSGQDRSAVYQVCRPS